MTLNYYIDALHGCEINDKIIFQKGDIIGFVVWQNGDFNILINGIEQTTSNKFNFNIKYNTNNI